MATPQLMLLCDRSAEDCAENDEEEHDPDHSRPSAFALFPDGANTIILCHEMSSFLAVDHMKRVTIANPPKIKAVPTDALEMKKTRKMQMPNQAMEAISTQAGPLI